MRHQDAGYALPPGEFGLKQMLAQIHHSGTAVYYDYVIIVGYNLN
jgi:hypothetical protein